MPFCNPDLIIVPENRFRTATTEHPAVIGLAESIKQVGQLQPILVMEDMTLVAGLHRLLACRRLKRDVWWVTEKEGKLLLADPRMRRIAEFQENFRRLEFSPIEMAKAVAEVDRAMRELYGSRIAAPGAQDGWSQEDTAKKLGYKSHGTVSKAIVVAKAVESGKIPALAQAKTMAEAVQIVKRVVQSEALIELARRQTYTTDTEIKNPLEFFGGKVILGDCQERLKNLASSICSLWITDPPWHIGIDKQIEPHQSDAFNLAAGCYDDSSDEILPLLSVVVKEMFRVSKQDAWVVMFCGAKHWSWLVNEFRTTGFAVYGKPLVWVKTNQDGSVFSAKSAAPTAWPGSSTDFMLLARKGAPAIAEMNKGDAFLHPPEHFSKRIHHSQKPVGLMRQIISRFHHPGTNPLLIDPFCGSGSTLVAARRLDIKQYFGYEKDPKFREQAVAFLVNSWQQEQQIVAETEFELDSDEPEFELEGSEQNNDG